MKNKKYLIYLLVGLLQITTLEAQQFSACNSNQFPTLTFVGHTSQLNNSAKSLLGQTANIIRDNPECRVVVTGYCQSNKSDVQRSWDRVNSVITYLVEKQGIRQERFIFVYGNEDGDCNTVSLRPAAENEVGPSEVASPHPHLRRN